MGEKGLSKDARSAVQRAAWQELKGQNANWDISGDGKTAFNSETKQNAAFDFDKGQWIDTKTGTALTRQMYE